MYMYYLLPCLSFIMETNYVLCVVHAEAQETVLQLERTVFSLWYKLRLKKRFSAEH